jgi:hypothetical protein
MWRLIAAHHLGLDLQLLRVALASPHLALASLSTPLPAAPARGRRPEDRVGSLPVRELEDALGRHGGEGALFVSVNVSVCVL